MPGRVQGRAWLLFVVVLAPLLAGCAAPAPPCGARSLVAGVQVFFATLAAPGGGIAVAPGVEPDARTTAWVLLAAGLVRRTGQEGGFQATPHVDWLRGHVGDLFREGTPVDSVANNLSLARVALQVWGRPASGVPVEDPAYADARTLEAAWERRYNTTTGQYGSRLNEHLFGAFAAWLFEPLGERHTQMAAFVEQAASDPVHAGAGDPYGFDVWWTGYARSALGVKPTNETLAAHLEAVMDDRVHETGGVVGFASGTRPDASSTAAALLGWQAAGEDLEGGHVRPAVGYLCSLQRQDGAVPFSGDQDIGHAKTTAEVAVALALLIQPVPRA